MTEGAVSTGSGLQYPAVMRKECKKLGMKPVCEHPSYCRNDKQGIYLNQYTHLSYGTHYYQDNPTWAPVGFQGAEYGEGPCIRTQTRLGQL